MPEPRAGETKDEYIPRCISFMVKQEGKDSKQAAAICYSMWERKNEMGIINKIDSVLNENKIGETILKQIKALDKWALASWGAKNFMTFDKGIQFDVKGGKFKGRVLIHYDRGSDTYTIEMGRVTKKLDWKQTYLVKQIFVGDLVNILDQQIG